MSRWMFTRVVEGRTVYLCCDYGNYWDSIVADTELSFDTYDEAMNYRLAHIEQTEDYIIGLYQVFVI